MKYQIESATNGYILKTIDKGETVMLDGVTTEKEEVETFVYETIDDILHFIAESEDPGSRHDEKRLYIIRAPGDKHPNFTEEHANVIWGKDEQDEKN